MESSFVDQLLDISTSLPITDTTSDTIRELVNGYILHTLGMDYYHVMTDGKNVRGKPGLGTATSAGGAWCNDNADTVPIYENDETKFRAQSTYSYLEMKPLWVTSNDGRPLHSTDNYVDHWSGAQKKRLPGYTNDEKFDVQTSIVVPLRQGEGHVFGFICLESKKTIEISDSAKTVLQRLADGIGATLSGNEDYNKKLSWGRASCDRLKEVARQSIGTEPLMKPAIFVGSSEKADHNVMKVIHEVLDQFSGHVHPIYWQEDKAVGTIQERVQDAISRCMYGICYFSEPDDSQSQQNYSKDNQNVTYEAGMMQSLCTSLSAAPRAWIPIRDFDSPSAPIDFAHLNMVQVHRDPQDKKKIDLDRLKADLSGFLEEVLNPHPSQ
jgi:predicted nucleotide-binding protein